MPAHESPRPLDPDAEAARLADARSTPAAAGPPAEFEGAITIEWPQSANGKLPGHAIRIGDAGTGRGFNTVLRLTVHASGDDVTWAELTMFADDDGRPIRVHAPGDKIHDDGEGDVLRGTFPFLVAGMSIAP